MKCRFNVLKGVSFCSATFCPAAQQTTFLHARREQLKGIKTISGKAVFLYSVCPQFLMFEAIHSIKLFIQS